MGFNVLHKIINMDIKILDDHKKSMGKGDLYCFYSYIVTLGGLYEDN